MQASLGGQGKGAEYNLYLLGILCHRRQPCRRPPNADCPFVLLVLFNEAALLTSALGMNICHHWSPQNFIELLQLLAIARLRINLRQIAARIYVAHVEECIGNLGTMHLDCVSVPWLRLRGWSPASHIVAALIYRSKTPRSVESAYETDGRLKEKLGNFAPKCVR